MRFINLVGQRFGKLKVKKLLNRHPGVYFCRCACGGSKTVRASNLRSKHVQSCGCLNSDLSSERAILRNTKHGRYGTGEYLSYQGAKRRCEDPKTDNYRYYGGRGIQFRFKSFKEFFAELGPRPQGKTVDRIENSGHYEKGNVRWATKLEQARNRRCDNCQKLLARVIELEKRLAERD